MEWPHFDREAWGSVLKEADTEKKSATPRIIASDRDEGAIEAARENAERAGVSGQIEFSRRAFSAIEPPSGPGWVVTNPPYGLRLSGNSDLRNLYAGLGEVLKRKCAGWHLTMLSAHPLLVRATGLLLDRGRPLTNGGIKVKLVNGRIV